MNHPLLGRRILIITAHPDDEAFLCSGATWLNAKHGGTNTLICATLGEKGSSHMRRTVTPERLKVIRRRELMSGAKIAKIKPVFFLHLPDGGLPSRQKYLYRRCRAILRRVKPDLILTFGRDGISGHVCHITCWQTGRRLAKEFKLPLYVFSVPPAVRTRVAKWLMARRVNPHYQSTILAYAKATVKVPMRPGYKRRVLSHYKSQLVGHDPFRGFPPYAVKLFTAAEYFAVAKTR